MQEKRIKKTLAPASCMLFYQRFSLAWLSSRFEWLSGLSTLAGDIVSCSWARHLTLTVPFSTKVYKWVPANLMLGVTLRWTRIPSRGEQKHSQSLHAIEIGISSSLMSQDWLVCRLHLPQLWIVCSLYFVIGQSGFVDFVLFF